MRFACVRRRSNCSRPERPAALPPQVRAREVDDLVAAPAQDRLQHIEREALRHLDGDGGRHSELRGRHYRVYDDWAGMGERFGDARVTVLRVLDADSLDPIASAVSAKFGLTRSVPIGRKPVDFCSSATNPSNRY